MLSIDKFNLMQYIKFNYFVKLHKFTLGLVTQKFYRTIKNINFYINLIKLARKPELFESNFNLIIKISDPIQIR